MGATLDRLLTLSGQRSDAALRKLVPAVRVTDKSIWEMSLPNSSYQAPQSAFWFISSGKGR